MSNFAENLLLQRAQMSFSKSPNFQLPFLVFQELSGGGFSVRERVRCLADDIFLVISVTPQTNRRKESCNPQDCVLKFVKVENRTLE